jgi:ABC-2 type transport system ATP-binding protein
MNNADRTIVFDGVSKFYGDILGVNRVNLLLQPGITSLVGPNGSGKTTLMNLMTGLIRPTRGTISILGIPTNEPERLFRKVGYCTQFDSFPRGLTGFEFVRAFLGLNGYSRAETDERTQRALKRVDLLQAADRKVAGYSKGMRQRVRLAQAIAHDPEVLVLDEPLNGLDPMARAEVISLFKQLAREGLHLVVSSHILHEVDMISDRVVLLNNGYVLAEGEVRGVRDEMDDHPLQILVRCDRPAVLAARMFEEGRIVEAQLADDNSGVVVRTRDADRFYEQLSMVVLEDGVDVEFVAPVDDNLNAVYQYLIGPHGGQ